MCVCCVCSEFSPYAAAARCSDPQLDVEEFVVETFLDAEVRGLCAPLKCKSTGLMNEQVPDSLSTREAFLLSL